MIYRWVVNMKRFANTEPTTNVLGGVILLARVLQKKLYLPRLCLYMFGTTKTWYFVHIKYNV